MAAWASGAGDLVALIAALAAVGLALVAVRQRASLRAALAQARESDQRFAMLSVAADAWLWETDADLRMTYISRLSQGRGNPSDLGKRRDEFPGIASDDPALWQRHLADLAARRPFDDFVYVREVPGGSRRTLKICGRPIFDAAGRFRGYRGTGTDVSREFEAKAGARRAERQLLDAINSATSGFALYTPDDRLALCNRRFTEIYAAIAPKLRPGESFESMIRAAAEAGLIEQAVGRVDAWVAERMAQHRVENSTLHMVMPDGRCLFVSDHRTSDGSRVTIHTDITEIKAREAALARQSAVLAETLNSVTEALVVFDKDFKLAIWNENFPRLFDYPRAMLQVGRPLEDFFRFNAKRGEYGPGEAEALVAARLAMFRSGEQTRYDRVRPDGTILEVRRRYPAGGGFLSTFIDVTERKRFENALQAAKEQAELASRAKTNFLANMSHELRTPLNAIIGFSEIIREQLLGPIGTDKYLDYMADIHLSGNHLLEVINDILDLSKVESGKFELLEKAVDLERVIASTLRLLGDKATKGQLTLRTRLPEPRPMLLADERAMKQILLNLLSNAVKFTQPGGTIEIAVELADTGEMRLIVEDTGIGFDEVELPHVLAPFGQIDSSLTRRFQGTGLGLPLVNSLARLHDGKLEIRSNPGIGTRAMVTLPAKRVLYVASVERTAFVSGPS